MSATLMLLVLIAGEPASAAAPSPIDARGGAEIVFAGGSVFFRAPADWNVYESPTGRELRLVLTPPGVTLSRGATQEGMWLALHPLPIADGPAAERLRRRLLMHMPHEAGAAATIDPPRAVRTAGRTARLYVLRAERRDEEGSAAESDRHGFHMIVETEWGICEVHAEAPPAGMARCEQAFELVRESLALRRPSAPQSAPAAHVAPAAAVLGVWKASASRLRLFPEGRIEVELDRVRDLAGGEPRGETIFGIFTARRDLLEVTFRDGSLLNLRWRLDEPDLLLTDHEGRTTLLKRLWE